MKKIPLALCASALFSLSFGYSVYAASGSVFISEVMYDLKTGSDTGREWAEVYNGSGTDVDLSFWKLREEGTNHKLEVVAGTGIVPAGGYAVIADNTDKFLADYPGYTGVLFDSSFSLKNTGEELILKDAAGADMDVLTYDPSIGAAGDGNSLQKRAGSWVAEIPTPGAAPAATPAAPGSPADSSLSSIASSSSPVSDSSPASSPYWPAEPQILVSAGPRSRVVVVGADTEFVGKALGISGKPLVNEQYDWTFGDGGASAGKKVLYSYSYPGDYFVSLNVSSGEYTAADYVTIKVIPADLVISGTGGDERGSYIEVWNKTAYRLDLSWWGLRAGGKTFAIPKDTFILAGGKIKFASAKTGLVVSANTSAELLYPNGLPVAAPVEHTETASSTPSVVPVAPARTSTESVSVSPPLSPVVSAVETAADSISGDVLPIELSSATTSDQFAAALPLEVSDRVPSVWVWILSLIALSLLAASAVILKRREDADRAGTGFSIIEEKV